MEFILIKLRAYHYWETDIPDDTEILLIRNDEYSDKNTRTLSRMFMEEVLGKDITAPLTLKVLEDYQVTNDDYVIWDDYDNKSESYRFEIECTYTNIATIPKD